MPNRAVDGTTAPVLAARARIVKEEDNSELGGTMPFDTPATENAERHATKLTKRHLVKSFWVLIVPLLFPSALAAEPSLAETIQYIEAKISATGTRQKYFRLNGGTVNYIKYGVYNSTSTYKFQLGALSTTVTLDGGTGGEIYGVTYVRASCARGTCISYRRVVRNQDGEIDSTTDKIEGAIVLSVKSHDAERVRKALTHAIKLSGGKDELF